MQIRVSPTHKPLPQISLELGTFGMDNVNIVDTKVYTISERYQYAYIRQFNTVEWLDLGNRQKNIIVPIPIFTFIIEILCHMFCHNKVGSRSV